MTIYSLDVLLFNFEPVCCSMSSSNCCFLSCIQISQEAGKVVWHFHLLKNFPQFVVIHIVKCFSLLSESEIGVFLKLPCFLCDPTNVGNLISGSSASLKPCLCAWKVYDRFFLFFSRQSTTCNLPSIFTTYCNWKLRSNHHPL